MKAVVAGEKVKGFEGILPSILKPVSHSYAALLNKSELKRKRPSSLNFSDLHRDWYPKICHPIQCRRTDPSLRFLLRQGARFHRIAENALVSLHRKLDMTA